MKLILLLLIATLLSAVTVNFSKVWVSDDLTIKDVKLIDRNGYITMYYNGKQIDSRYIIISCMKPAGYCLIEKWELK